MKFGIAVNFTFVIKVATLSVFITDLTVCSDISKTAGSANAFGILNTQTDYTHT